MRYSLFLLLGVVPVIGCGPSAVPLHPTAPILMTVHITWTTDGNPLVPVCGQDERRNCKQGYVFIDKTTGVSTEVPITARKFDGTIGVNDVYEIHVTGFDGAGQSIESKY